MTARAVLLLALAIHLTAAEPWSLQIAEADPVVRAGLVWRCRITGDIPPGRFNDGPYLAQISLTQGATTLAAQEFQLVRLGQVLGGLDVVLVPTTPPDPAAAIGLTVTVTDPSRRDLQHATRRLPTPLGLQRTLEQQQRQFGERGEQDPLPWLWLEQAAELVMDGASLATCQKLDEIAARLDRWLAGERPPSTLQALRDPRDDSVQPYRLHLPGDAPPTMLAVLLVEPGRPLRKCAWPTVPEPWLAAARSAACAVVEVYPAGDQAWTGIARRRVWTTIAAAITADARLASLPIALLGSGRGAEAVIALAEESPRRIHAIGLHDARLTSGGKSPVERHAQWQALHQAGERPQNLLGIAVLPGAGGDQATRGWVLRLSHTGHAAVLSGTTIEEEGFWQALRTTVPDGRREWLALRPMSLGRLHIEELADWGIAASLSVDAGAVLTANIARLRAEAPLPVSVDGKPYRAPAAASTPRKVLGQATGPVAAYADGPFTVVVGTGESAAAQRENRALADAFASAWAIHAHARVPMIDDIGLDDDALPGRHLVLIGNPRSNLLLARLASRTTLPVQWDARRLTVAGQDFLRAERRAVALAWPHPAHDGRLLVILDGSPAWKPQGLPLAGLPDLVISGVRPDDAPALLRTFGNDWR